MTQRVKKIPGPDHPIAIEPCSGRVTVTLGGVTIADTRNALTLTEAGHPKVQYIPREDVRMSLLEQSTHETYCPYKGVATYFSIPLGGDRSVNAVWSYAEPYDAVASIKDRLAFYPDRVDAITEHE